MLTQLSFITKNNNKNMNKELTKKKHFLYFYKNILLSTDVSHMVNY